MSAQDSPKRNPGHAFQAVGEEGALVVVPGESEIRVLNPVGSKVYSLLDGKHSRDEIVRAVIEEFDIEEEAARADVDAFLDDLRSRGMLAPASAGAVPEEASPDD